MNKRLIKPGRLVAMALILLILLTVYLVFLYKLQIISSTAVELGSNSWRLK